MVEVVRLGELCAQAKGAAVPATRSFTAVVQHVTSAKRMRMDRSGGGGGGGAPSRVATYHVMHVADPTKSFFKLLCWGDTLPTLQREDHEGEDISLCVGDIVLFSSCVVKTFRGNVEAQYTRHSSVQLLYRRDRYFNTRDVRLKDFYPMIEWYKKHRHEFLVMAPPSEGDSERTGKAASTERKMPCFAMVRDLREDMLANLKGTIHEFKRPTEADADAARHHQQNSSDFDGAQLCEVTLVDAQGDSIVLNLWDQYAEPRFATKLLAHRGTVDVVSVVISHNAVMNRLLANTTPRTEFRFLGSAHGMDGGKGSLAGDHRAFTTVDALESASLPGDRVVLENVVIEHIVLGCFVGKSDRAEPQFMPLLVESYCSVCEQTLPLVRVDTIPQLYASCKNRCRVKNGESERKWRYRIVQMVLQDDQFGRLTIHVGDAVMTRLLGNIHAELLIHSHAPSGGVLPFHPRDMVARLLNALVWSNALRYRVELEKRDTPTRQMDRRTSLLLNESLGNEDDGDVDGERAQLTHVAVEISPIIQSLW